VIEKLDGDCKEISVAVKYGIVCLQFLLHSRPAECWRNDEVTFAIFRKIMNYGMDE